MPPAAPEAADPDARIEVSIIVKPRRPLDELQAAARPLSREDFAASYGADPSDIARSRISPVGTGSRLSKPASRDERSSWLAAQRTWPRRLASRWSASGSTTAP